MDWKNGKAFSSQGKVRNFEQTGKVGKYLKTRGISENVTCYFYSDCVLFAYMDQVFSLKSKI